VTGRFDPDGNIKSIGIQCALCHSTVDDAFRPSLGHRLDGWPNRDLNVGGIIASAPDLSVFEALLGLPDEEIRDVLNSWGLGKFDAELILDGKAIRPDGRPAATLIPPAFGLAGVNNHTWTGSWGTVFTGTPSLLTSKCMARAPSSTRAWTMLRNIRLRPGKASVISATPRT
jgi:hypothetical protein